MKNFPLLTMMIVMLASGALFTKYSLEINEGEGLDIGALASEVLRPIQEIAPAPIVDLRDAPISFSHAAQEASPNGQELYICDAHNGWGLFDRVPSLRLELEADFAFVASRYDTGAFAESEAIHDTSYGAGLPYRRYRGISFAGRENRALELYVEKTLIGGSAEGIIKLQETGNPQGAAGYLCIQN